MKRSPIVLIVERAVSQDPKRQAEYEYCLRENRERGFFSHIEIVEGRNSFASHFSMASAKFAGCTIVLANSDIVFSESIRLAENIRPLEVYALARWDSPNKRHGWHLTQDVWIFRAPTLPIPAHFTLGVPGCDNRLAAILTDVGYRVLNPSNSIRCYHVHSSAVRSYTKKDRIAGRYMGVTPDWINLVSFSLFGGVAKYLRGAIENARSVPELLPGWRAVFYVDQTVPTAVIEELVDAGALIRNGTLPDPYFRRLEALREPHVARVLFRDADSRISKREVAAVRQWIASKRHFHVMRDHPHHKKAIMGGMWGAIAWHLPHLYEAAADFLAKRPNPASRNYGVDEAFLAAVVWPLVRKSFLENDLMKGSFLPGEDAAFVGERIDERNQPNHHSRGIRSRWINGRLNHASPRGVLNPVELVAVIGKDQSPLAMESGAKESLAIFPT